MAKKPKTPKEDKIKTELGADLQSGKDFYGQYFPTEALKHYEDPLAVEDQNLLNLRNSFANPLTSMYSQDELAGHFANLDEQVRNGLPQASAEAEKVRLKGLTKQNEAFAGNMSQDEKWALGNLRGQMDPNSSSFVGKNSSDISDIINRFKSGLDGYTAAENAGFREQAERGLDATAATQTYNATRDAARNRVRGAAAGAQVAGINKNRMLAGRELEQELFLKNADEKQNRLSTFADFTRSNDDANFNRSTLAGRDFRDFLKDRGDAAYGRGQDAIGSYESTLGASADKRFQIGQFNIGQDEKTNARDVGTQMGLVGLLGSRRSEEEQNAILKKRSNG